MPAVNSSQTVSDALHTATAMLSRVTSSARLDAELLLEYVTGLPRVSFRSAPERELPTAAGWSFQQLVMRRMKGEPVAYIRGQQEFWSLLLEVTPAVLIPRPETELLVELTLAHLRNDASTTAPTTERITVADLGTGSGAVALAIASERPQAQVVATDASNDALSVASRNAGRLQLANVSFLHGDWCAPLGERRFDAIMSNPPYVAPEDRDIAPEVRRFEPAAALFAGNGGLESLTVIARQSPRHLRPGGWLLLEHGWKQGPQVRDLLVRNGFAHVRSHADLAGHERVTEGCLP